MDDLASALRTRPVPGDDDPTAPGTGALGRTQPARGPRLRVGDQVGRYRVLEPLGAGGMGTVFRARDPELGRDVALKVLHVGDGDDRSLLTEARALAALSDPNVVGVFGVVRTASRQWALAMELVEGPSLQQWLVGGLRPREEVLRVFIDAGRALAAAHAAGFVHCDFKPANVLLGTDGRARVTDFGLATTIGATASGPAGSVDGLEATVVVGRLAGTPAYMAPEQHLGGTVDARTDQFAFCVALFEALTGVRPFRGRSLPELARAKLAYEVPVELDRLPRRLRNVLLRGLSPAPEDRHGSMDELLEALESARRPTVGVRAWGAVAGLTEGLLMSARPRRRRASLAPRRGLPRAASPRPTAAAHPPR